LFISILSLPKHIELKALTVCYDLFV
jgi:hypothetical protein